MKRIFFLLMLFGLSLFFTVLSAQAAPPIQENTTIIDDEIETALTTWLKELFAAAGRKNQEPRLIILASSEINAGALSGNCVIVHTGLILACKNVDQLIAVLAHEVGHIAGGHITRLDQQHRSSAGMALATVLLGGAAAALTGNFDPLVAGMMGGSHIYERSMLAHSRDEESAADQSAIAYLKALGWISAIKGLRDFFLFLDNHISTDRSLSAYMSSHPPSKERAIAVNAAYEKLKHLAEQRPDNYEEIFQRIKAKLQGFLAPQKVSAYYPLSNKSLAARYARAIAAGVLRATPRAMEEINALCLEYPQDPYFLELKGQILFDGGKPKEAIPILRKAFTMRKRSPSLRLILGQALLAVDDPRTRKEALNHLAYAADRLPDTPGIWRLLAIAYGKDGQEAKASLALAEESLRLGDLKRAEMMAQRAKKLAPHNRKIQEKADDILSEAKKA